MNKKLDRLDAIRERRAAAAEEQRISADAAAEIEAGQDGASTPVPVLGEANPAAGGSIDGENAAIAASAPDLANLDQPTGQNQVPPVAPSDTLIAPTPETPELEREEENALLAEAVAAVAPADPEAQDTVSEEAAEQGVTDVEEPEVELVDAEPAGASTETETADDGTEAPVASPADVSDDEPETPQG